MASPMAPRQMTYYATLNQLASRSVFCRSRHRTMRSFSAILTTFVLTAAVVSSADRPVKADNAAVAIGSTIGDLAFTDIRSLPRRLSDFGTPKAVVIVFTTTTCPLVRQTLPALAEMEKKFAGREVQFVAINVGPGDTIREMAAQAIELDVPFAFVRDYDHLCVRALGVTRTPEIVILDHKRQLRYRGRLHDQFRLGGTRAEPTRHDLELALDEVLTGKTVSVPETPVDGCLISAPPSPAESPAPVYFGQVDAILHRHCAACHRPESNAPFPLLTFDDATANASMISEVVRNETMPPWYAAGQHGVFQNDTSLPDADQRSLLAWVAAGTPAGEESQASPIPAAPSSEWRIGEPDLVITMLEEHSIPATGFVDYRYTVLPYAFLHETWVEAVEIRPLNSRVVHHCNMAYVSGGKAGEETFITGYVPGGQPVDLARFDGGVAYRIPQGSVLGLQIHYTTTGVEEKCRIQIGLRYPRRTVNKQFRHFLLDPRGWRIPAGDPAFRIDASHTLEHDATLLGLFTHMHVRGRDMSFFAKPTDRERELLLRIPNFNFEWQLGYELPTGSRRYPKGTAIEATAHFDNSKFNPYNPDPGATVRYGLQTVDEMFNGFVFYVADEEHLKLDVDPQTGIARPSTP